MKEFYLLIDDQRSFDVEKTARTVADGLEALQDKYNKPTHLVLDNDLGDDQPMEGVDILEWARDNNLVPPNVFIVSDNSVAKDRMEKILHYDLKYVKDLKGWWRKIE